MEVDSMPAVSEAQRRAACMAYAAKKGKIDPKKLKGAAKAMYKSMTKEQLRDFCKELEDEE
jgi:hypothetical protein